MYKPLCKEKKTDKTNVESSLRKENIKNARTDCKENRKKKLFVKRRKILKKLCAKRRKQTKAIWKVKKNIKKLFAKRRKQKRTVWKVNKHIEKLFTQKKKTDKPIWNVKNIENCLQREENW